MTKKKMCEIKGISDAKVDKIKEAAAKLEKVNFATGLQWAEKRRACFRISSGSTELDRILVSCLKISCFFLNCLKPTLRVEDLNL